MDKFRVEILLETCKYPADKLINIKIYKQRSISFVYTKDKDRIHIYMSDCIHVYFGMLSLSMTGNLVESTRFLR